MEHLQIKFRSISTVFLILFCVIMSAGQKSHKNKAEHKTVFINGSIFHSGQSGIKLLDDTEWFIHPEIDLGSMHLMMQIEETESEIDKLIVQNKSINEKYLVLKELRSLAGKRSIEYRDKMVEDQIKYIGPIFEKIREKIREFSQLKGYTMIIDSFYSRKIVGNDEIDATAEFLQFCNDAFEKEKLEVPQM